METIPLIRVPEGKSSNSAEDSKFNLLALGINQLIKNQQKVNKKVIEDAVYDAIVTAFQFDQNGYLLVNTDK